MKAGPAAETEVEVPVPCVQGGAEGSNPETIYGAKLREKPEGRRALSTRAAHSGSEQFGASRIVHGSTRIRGEHRTALVIGRAQERRCGKCKRGQAKRSTWGPAKAVRENQSPMGAAAGVKSFQCSGGVGRSRRGRRS
ncbi:unnamed protein product [Calypogeia fissa]